MGCHGVFNPAVSLQSVGSFILLLVYYEASGSRGIKGSRDLFALIASDRLPYLAGIIFGLTIQASEDIETDN